MHRKDIKKGTLSDIGNIGETYTWAIILSSLRLFGTTGRMKIVSKKENE